VYVPIASLPRKVLVDTTILLDIVFEDVLPSIQRHCLTEEKEVLIVKTYLQSCDRRVTTAQVLTEIDRHLKEQAKGKSLADLRRKTFGITCNAFLEANIQPISNLDLDIVATFGPTDTALLDIAHRESLCLITDDYPLAGKARKQKLDVLNSWQIICHPDFDHPPHSIL